MVSGQESAATGVQHSGDDLFDSSVHSLNGLDSSLKNAGVADHIAVCEVQDDHVVLAALDALDALVSDLGGAHLRLEVVGSDLRAGDDTAILAQLGLAVLGQVLAQDVLQLNRRISDFAVGHGGVILGHADVVDLLAAAAALEAGEGVVAEDAGHLTGAVGTEVHEDNGVAVLHTATLAGDAAA